MDSATIIGLTAGTLTTASFLPQVFKIWKSRSTKDISLGMFVSLCLGIGLWIVYGVLIRSIPVIITNGITLVLGSIILGLKLKYK